MNTRLLNKYVYQIRTRNGVVVDNLKILGHSEDEAKRKLEQMYRHCEILDSRITMPERAGNSNYEDVLNLITVDY